MSEAHRSLLEAIAMGHVRQMRAEPGRWINRITMVPVSNSARKWASWHRFALMRPSGEVSLTTAGLEALQA